MSGGTGGHLWPALALADGLRSAGFRTSLLSEGRAVETSLLDRAGCEALTLPPPPHGRGRLGRVVTLPRATMAARRVLRAEGVDVVVGTGGGASVAVGFAARSLGLPLCLLEQNAVLGKANRLLARFARRLYLGLPTVAPSTSRARLTGTPVRAEFGRIERDAARAELGLDRELPLLVVTGGSQGAQVLNEIVPAAVCALRRPVQVVHLSGDGKDTPVRTAYAAGADHGVVAVVRPLATDMPVLFAAADLVVCRGGGCTVSELVAAARPAVLVPYPHHADRQQFHNAKLLEGAAAGVVIEQSDLREGVLASTLDRLLTDRLELEAMGARARGIAPVDAVDVIVRDLAGMVVA